MKLEIKASGDATELSDEEFAHALRCYSQRLIERYGRLDLEVLLPHTDQDDAPHVPLRDIFVLPDVRADPPPVSLPPELLRRLTERGELSDTDLPPGVDRNQLTRISEAQQRPAEDLLTVLRAPQHQKTVILGDPGSGKSTLGRWLALALISSEDLGGNLTGRLPLIIELRRYADERWRESTFEDFLAHLHATEGLSLPPAALHTILASGRALVVFDGLDELFDPGFRERATQRIAQFAAAHPGVQIVVTSRPIGYRRTALTAAGFSHHALNNLTSAQIEAFTRDWYRVACPDDATAAGNLSNRLLDAVTHTPSVRELAGNPLLLTILAIIGRRQTLPRDRHGVFKHAVAVLVARLDQDVKHLKPDCSADVAAVLELLDAEASEEMLRLVARRMQEGEGGISGNHIHGDELEAAFRTFLHSYDADPGPARKAARTLVQQLQERNFILSHYGGNVYGFVHRAFLEYLAAADIVARFHDREWTPDDLIDEVFRARMHEDSWHEVLLLTAGQLSPQYAARVVDLFFDDYLRSRHSKRFILAARALTEVRRIGRLADQSKRLAAIATSDGTYLDDLSDDYSGAMPALRSLPETWTGRPLLQRWYCLHGAFIERWQLHTWTDLASQFVTSRRWHQTVGTFAPAQARRKSLEALARGWADEETRALLIDRATNDPDEFTRPAALGLLARGWADEETRALLIDRATNDPDEFPRQAALDALARRWADEETRALLINRATNDPHDFPRQAALLALAEGWADEETRALLTDRATNDPKRFPRQAALLALAEGWADEETRALLIDRATNDPRDFPRQAALLALAEGWADEETRALLIDRATNDPKRFPRQVALGALAEGWADEETRALLIDRATNDPAHGPRQVALLALAEGWANEETRALLTDRATNDPDEIPRQAALDALAEGWADEETRALLINRATNDPDDLPRQAAVGALAEGWADEETRALLTDRATNDPDDLPRQVALGALADSWADEETRALLINRATNDSQHTVRRIALHGLSVRWFSWEGLVELLRHRALDEDDDELRLTALRQWAVHHGPEAGDLVAERMREDSSPSVRAGAAWTLASGWHEHPAQVAALQQASQHEPDEEARAEITQACVAAHAWQGGS
ncbi:HEAT repeat domain-containing protein [Streptomyces bohaiensis]|uniref:HEAT repeat domain-containing protein n=1 Tax=Streptomyces bohaiensis TaxID=1431344 RepID=UPI003B79F533